jgi:catechol 2,3-dioxygenase-like lactoylglutathione lyase family enzyme
MSTSQETAVGLNAFKPQVLHVAYHVADIERALGFYVGVLGLKETMRIPLGKNLAEVILAFPESKSAGIILMWNTDRAKTTPLKLSEQGEGYSRFVLRVSDVEKSLAHLVANGAPVVTQTTSHGNFKYAMVKDPDGYVIELIEFVK